ncbi:ribbon-helix-helix protein, CopG family [Arthrobacter sp. A2-55]|uniref:ribbon-helix-helix protein, CopG family n=1 Tax=Arthrobacter sp. A2-55 TaxID=2897337 RepID=UPI0021CDA319|nr:ribbon-helix-helix protein, CopG family [Arthrobacter sp. A2-55]MCU6481534.1 ribbon-helix-helix protein, CopG family [Arthrobacter sp. A2-55]
MNLRIPDEMDQRLDALAAEQHISKSALLLQGAELVLRRAGRRQDIHDSFDFVMTHDAGLMKRLEDA